MYWNLYQSIENLWVPTIHPPSRKKHEEDVDTLSIVFKRAISEEDPSGNSPQHEIENLESFGLLNFRKRMPRRHD